MVYRPYSVAQHTLDMLEGEGCLLVHTTLFLHDKGTFLFEKKRSRQVCPFFFLPLYVPSVNGMEEARKVLMPFTKNIH